MKLNVYRVLASCTSGAALLFTALPASAQNQYWVRQLGSVAYDGAEAAAPDGSGGVYLGGNTLGNLGGQNLGYDDAWLARYDVAGNQLWVRQFGTSMGEGAYAAAADGSGGVYLCGYTHGNLAGSNAGAPDAWLARYDGAGNQLWLRQLGSSGADIAYAAASDGSGGVFIGGSTTGNLGGPNHGHEDAWLAHYDGAGNQLWLRHFGTTQLDIAYAGASDGSGGVFVGGSTMGVLGGALTGSEDAWLAHYDGAGNQLWVRQLGTPGDDRLRAAAPDGSGGLYASGETFGSLGGSSAGSDDAWLARYDAAGNQTWIRQLGTSTNDMAYAAAPDASGGVFVGGRTSGDLGGPSAGSADPWLARFDGAGNQLWIRQFGSSDMDWAHAAASDGADGVYVCGLTNGGLGGGGGGNGDPWLARYAHSLTLFCEPGQSGVIACPCSNPPSGPGSGCDNSSATGGATLSFTGNAQLTNDSLVFTAQGEKPTALSVLLQGTLEISTGVFFGQGVRCVSGALHRLYVHAAVGGAVTMPNGSLGDPSVSARSAALGDTIPPGQSRWYSVYYRDPLVLGACPAASTFNTGPTMRAVWAP